MALIRQIESEEWDILSIVTDPILLGEFLRNTADGSPTQDEWPKMEFKYRWYQKDLLTDETEFISLIAGRAVGKCSPWTARVYTYPYGYMQIKDLMGGRHTRVLYSMDDTKNLVQRRFNIKRQKFKEDVYTVTTRSGYIFEGTANHPILTPRGWIMISDLTEEDKAAVMTYLPHESLKKELTWEELRWLGYAAGRKRIHAEMPFVMKFQANVLEFQRIAEYMDAKVQRNPDGTYQFMRRRGPLPHYFTKRIERDLKLNHLTTHGLVRVPLQVKSDCLENNIVFLESFFSIWADFTIDTISFEHHAKSFTYDIQELLLRLGIESRVAKLDNDMWQLVIDDAYAYWSFFQNLSVPGIVARNLRQPTTPITPTPWMKFEDIASIVFKEKAFVYAVSVHDYPNYISDNVLVHNSLVLEDRIIFKALNAEECFPVTKESTLVTANVSQMTPILDRLILRLTNSLLLKDFLKGQINRSKGTMDFPMGSVNYRINARIAGSKGENNMVPNLRIPMRNTAAPLYSNI